MMSHLKAIRRQSVVLATIVLLSGAAIADEAAVFRVCADPNNLPFSAKTEDGLENRIAQLWADELGQPLEYTWFPQRRGFLRQTLKSHDQTGRGGFKCDVVMGMAAQADSLLTTNAYYRSTYALVYVKGQRLDAVATGEDFVNLDPALRGSLKIGAFVPTPGTKWLARHGMTHQVTAFQAMSADPAAYPGEIVEKELVSGRLDVAIVWGPIGGYFAKHAKDVEIVVIPLQSEPGIRFDFAIAAGVRYGDGERKRLLEKLIVDTADDMDEILAEYNVPLLDLPTAED
jgi:quinoprotein dehydrogenase-associated probable ABC transporter substrate-binding protein